MRNQEQLREDAKVLREAMKGWGTNEEKIIQLTAYRSNQERQIIMKEFKTLFGRDLIEDFKSELSGHLRVTVIAMYTSPIEYDAKQLRNAISGAGTDEDTIIEILSTRSNETIKEIRLKYKELFNADLEKDIISDTSGFFRKLLVSLVQGNRDKTDKIDIIKLHNDVQVLYESGEGQVGTDEEAFTSIFALRSPIELRYISAEYAKATNRSLFTAIEKEFSGSIKKLILAILFGNINPAEYFARRIRDACECAGTKDEQLIRVLVTRDEIDLKEIDQVYRRCYNKTLHQEISSETSGDYKKILLAMVAS